MAELLKRSRVIRHVAGLILFVSISAGTFAEGEQCFVPRVGSVESSTLFVDPGSKVCRAFERELKAYCSVGIPMVDFTPTVPGSGVTTPAWESIPLFNADGCENAAAFKLLEKLVWADAFTGYSVEKESRARRAVLQIMEEVRTAHARNLHPRFDKVSIDLEGRGNTEVLFRFLNDLGRNPKPTDDLYGGNIGGPRLFLQRALDLVNADEHLKASTSAAGGQLMSGHVLLFDDDPYLLSLTPDVAYVYAAYSRRNRPKIPEERAEGRTFILPQMRCLFDLRVRREPEQRN